MHMYQDNVYDEPSETLQNDETNTAKDLLSYSDFTFGKAKGRHNKNKKLTR